MEISSKGLALPLGAAGVVWFLQPGSALLALRLFVQQGCAGWPRGATASPHIPPQGSWVRTAWGGSSFGGLQQGGRGWRCWC